MQPSSGARQRQPQPVAASTNQKQAVTAERSSDRFSATIFSGFNQMLSSQVSKDRSNLEIATLISFITKSRILDCSTELPRNDSLQDIVARKDLYTALLNFIESLISTQLSQRRLYSVKDKSTATAVTSSTPRFRRAL